MIRDTVMAHTRLAMVANMKAISWMTFLVEMENLPGLKEVITTATGRMACNLVRESLCSQMEAFMTECGETTKGQEMAKWRGSKARANTNTTVLGQTTRRLASVLTRGLIARNTKVAFQTIKWLVRVPVLIMGTEALTLGNSETTSDMATVRSRSTMAVDTKDHGLTIWSTATVHTRGKTTPFWWEDGRKVCMSKDNWRSMTVSKDEL